jgi:hypothetical protein
LSLSGTARCTAPICDFGSSGPLSGVTTIPTTQTLSVAATAVSEFSLTFDQGMIRRRLYLSELNVRLDQPLANLNPGLQQLAAKLSSMTSAIAHHPFEVGGVSLGTDVTHAVYKVPSFIIERKLNAPFNENRFYTKAPLQTEQHISILREFEEILGLGG